MKHPVIVLNLHKGEISVNGVRSQITLPKGCIGFCFAFESKKAAREWDGEASLIRVEKKTKKGGGRKSESP